MQLPGIGTHYGAGNQAINWLTQVASVLVGAAIGFGGTVWTSHNARKLQQASNEHALQLQARQFESEERTRKKIAHRERGEELYAANARLREELRVVTTDIAKKLQAKQFTFWDSEHYFTAGRDDLARLFLLVEVDYPSLAGDINQLANAFAELISLPSVAGDQSNAFHAASELLENMSQYSKASVLFAKHLVAEMKKAEHAD